MSVTHANVPRDRQNNVTQTVEGTCADSGLNTIIAAPTNNQRIVITAFTIQQASPTGTVINIVSGTTNLWRVYGVSDGDGVTMTLNEFPIHLNKAEALKLRLDGANTVSYSFQYYIEQMPA